MTMSINEAKARFYALPLERQCAVWNTFAKRIKEKDGVSIFILPNETAEDFYESVNQLPKYYNFEPVDMFMLGVYNNPNETDTKYLFVDEENHEIVTVNTIDECTNEETVEAFLEWFGQLK